MFLGCIVTNAFRKINRRPCREATMARQASPHSEASDWRIVGIRPRWNSSSIMGG